MTETPVSVVIVSRGRPAALARCLTGVSQLVYPNYEVIVVADPEGIGAAEQSSFANHLKLIKFDEANISKARNVGIAAAAGEIVAFIDDDAVPEPTWLNHLAQPFAEEDVLIAGGFVRGRNGISFQWQARSVDRSGEALPIEVDSEKPTVLSPSGDYAIKTEGTNMAVRREVLAELGGFDPAYHFCFDETDLNMRIAVLDGATAIVPLAEVHHGFHASDRRGQNRVPRDLSDLGASTAVFLRKHCPEPRHAAVWAKLQREQKNRLLRHMVTGDLEPGDVRRLMAGLRKGYEAGQKREVDSQKPIPRAVEGFRSFPGKAGQPSVLLAGGLWRRRKILREAFAARDRGAIVTAFIFSRTGVFHRVRFRDGIWVQRGGLFGKSRRTDPWFRLTLFNRRVRSERARVAEQRALLEE